MTGWQTLRSIAALTLFLHCLGVWTNTWIVMFLAGALALTMGWGAAASLGAEGDPQ